MGTQPLHIHAFTAHIDQLFPIQWNGLGWRRNERECSQGIAPLLGHPQGAAPAAGNPSKQTAVVLRVRGPQPALGPLAFACSRSEHAAFARGRRSLWTFFARFILGPTRRAVGLTAKRDVPSLSVLSKAKKHKNTKTTKDCTQLLGSS